MNPFIEQSDVLIFDLDGTLYEDTDHFDYYGTLLQQQLPSDQKAAFTEEYEAMKSGNHAVTIGKAYDAGQDSVLTVDPMTAKATAVQDWEGTYWTAEKVREIYPDPLAFNFVDRIAVGDGWWFPYVAARHLGLDPENAYGCYTATKEYMVTDAFQLTQTPGLKEGLRALMKDKQLVLATNSEKEDVGRLLKDLDLENIFDDIVDSAEKPAATTEIFKRVMERYCTTPQQTLSIGDNFMNEIAPALSLGMKAIFIQPSAQKGHSGNLCTVGSLTEVL